MKNSQSPDKTPPEQPVEVGTRDQAEACMAIIATLTVQLEDEVNRQNAKLLIAHQNDGTIQDIRKRLDRYEAGLRLWVLNNKKEFGPTQTLELRQGWVSWKQGQRALSLLVGWTEEMVINRLKQLKAFAGCVRVKEEIDKRRILDANKPGPGLTISAADLERAGLKVVRLESVHIEPKLENAKTLLVNHT